MIASFTLNGGAVWIAIGIVIFVVGLYTFCLAQAAKLGSDLAGWGKPTLGNLRPIGERDPRDAEIIQFPRRFRVIEGALDAAGDEADSVAFDWPGDGAA